MSGDTFDFPNTPEEFIAGYSFKDSKEVYTNGAELISVFRVKQMLEHYFVFNRSGHWIKKYPDDVFSPWNKRYICSECGRTAQGALKNMPYCRCGAKMTNGGISG